jgi:hypothetical protein
MLKKIRILIGIVVISFTLIQGCKKDTNLNPSLNYKSTFFSFNSTMIESLKENNNPQIVKSRNQIYLVDTERINSLKLFVCSEFEADSVSSLFVNEFGYPIWDKIVLLEIVNSTNHIALVPFAKETSENVLAVLPILIDEFDGFKMSDIMPRLRGNQLTNNLISNNFILNARMICKFDLELFNKVDNLHYIVSQLDYEPIAQERQTCYEYWVTISYTSQGELTMIDQGGDGGWYWGYEVVEYQHTEVLYFCSNAQLYEWYINYISDHPSSPGGQNEIAYISEIEQTHAQEAHDLLLSVNPDYYFLNKTYKECVAGGEPFAKNVIAEMLIDIINQQNKNTPNLSDEQLRDIITSAYQYSELKDFVEGAIEVLADNGIYLSFTGTLWNISQASYAYERVLSYLCSTTAEDKGFLLLNPRIFSDIIKLSLQNNTSEQLQQYINALLENKAILSSRPFAVLSELFSAFINDPNNNQYTAATIPIGSVYDGSEGSGSTSNVPTIIYLQPVYSDCNSWKFQPVGPNGNYQACGISGLYINFLYLYFDSDNEIEIGLYSSTLRDTWYFELPRITATGDFISPGKAANLATSVFEGVEFIIEGLYRTKPPQSNIQETQLQNDYIGKLKAGMQALGGRFTKENSYNVTSHEYLPSPWPTDCDD